MSKKFSLPKIDPRVRDIGAGAFLLGSAYLYTQKPEQHFDPVNQTLAVIIPLGLGAGGVLLIARGLGLFGKK